MSHEKVKSISIKNNEVWINSKSNNDTEPFRTWHCKPLTSLLINEGKDALDIAILKDYEEGMFQSTRSVVNKYTNALITLEEMEEYNNYNWRLSNYTDDDPIRINRRGPGYVELLKKALQIKPSTGEAKKVFTPVMQVLQVTMF